MPGSILCLEAMVAHAVLTGRSTNRKKERQGNEERKQHMKVHCTFDRNILDSAAKAYLIVLYTRSIITVSSKLTQSLFNTFCMMILLCSLFLQIYLLFPLIFVCKIFTNTHRYVL